MSIGVKALTDTIASHLASLGVFERVNQHEPKNAPGNGLSCAVWVNSIDPVPAHSGLRSTSGRVAFMARIYGSMLQEPQDAIDSTMVEAVDLSMTALSADFELGGNAAYIDLLGATGMTLSAKAGYLNQDGKLFRVMDIVIPVVINDLWEQVR